MKKRNPSRFGTASWLTATAISLYVPSSVMAQTASDGKEASAPPGPLEEIVVSVQRRDQNLQSVPITVEALSAAQLQASGVEDVTDLGALAAGLIPATQFGFFQPHLRGVGTTAPGASVENPVALYVDGVYIPSQTGGVFALPGIERIEVIKGPQGTLFGRNATGGLIHVITKDPEQGFSGRTSLTAGNYATLGGSIYMTGGLTENLASNLSVYYQNQGDGYGTNHFTGKDVNKSQDLAIRQKNLFTLSDRDTLLLTLNYEQNRSSPVLVPAPGTTPLGGPPYTGSRWSANGYFQPLVDMKQGGASLKYDHDFDFAQFESVSAYSRGRTIAELDGTLVVDWDFALNIEPVDRRKQYTQEFTLRSRPDSSINWTAGLYYIYVDARLTQGLEGGLIAPLADYLVVPVSKIDSYAAYAQASKEIFPNTTLTLGARETFERRRFSATHSISFAPGGPYTVVDSVEDAQLKTSRPTWRVALDHQFTDDILGKVSYNRGFKSGGHNELAPPVLTYPQETLDAFEIGMKSDLLDQYLRINAAAFYYDYKNVQNVKYPAGTLIVYSAPKATLYGVDLDVKAAFSHNFTIAGGLEYLHATYEDFPDAQLSTPAPGGGSILSSFNAEGRRLPMAPKWSLNIAPLYTVPLKAAGKLTLSVNYSYNDGFYYEPDNRLHQGAYSLWNTTATWDSAADTYSVQLWGKNLTNKAYTTGMYAQGNGDYAQYAAPRTFGFTVSRQF